MITQIYIQGQLIDLFNDESISVNQSIKNIRDVSKTFTTFTQSFSVPASRTNNKLFKHYYNFNIVDGFDARKRVDAVIELNSMPFQYGKIQLNGVELKNNKPSSYNITFYGRTVDLKDILGEDKLQVLSNLNTHSLTYDNTTVKTNLQKTIGVNDIICPLITHTDRLYYDSSVTGGSDGNLYYNVISPLQGVLWTQLKYAIRVHTIIEAIEEYYGIVFSDDFLDSTQIDYYGLFMWLHRNKGDVTNGSQVPTFPYLVSDWSNSVGSTGASIEYTENLVIPSGLGDELIDNSLDIQTVSASEYEVTIKKDGVFFWGQTGLVGNNLFDTSDFNLIDGTYTVTITSDSAITFTKCEWSVETDSDLDTFDTGSFSTSTTFTFEITEQIPEIKVIDFISGLFKMFNLIVYVNNSGVYVVDTLDNFYNSGNSIDISRYIDVAKSNVTSALPYKEIVFKYEDTKTFFAENHLQLFNYEWGSEEYNDNEKLDGSTYTVSIPFNHSKYERLLDINTSTSTDVQWGYFTDDNGDSYIGSPLLFYPVNESGTTISFRNTATTNQAITSYIIPSNSLSVTSASQNINFKKELNEYNSSTDYPDTLFQTYYSEYIGSVFNKMNRLTKVTAYLPLSILLNYTLADRFVINGNSYKINSIKTNLETGKSELELLNDL